MTGGADINFMNFQEYAAPTSPGFEQGQLQISDFRNRMYNVEALAIYNNSYKKFDYGVTIGGNLYKVDNKTQIVTAKEMVMRDVIALQSFTSKEITEGTYRKQINSLYGSINLAYGNFVYLDATLCHRETTLIYTPRYQEVSYSRNSLRSIRRYCLTVK